MALIAVPPSLTLRSSGRWALRTATMTPGPGLDGRQQFVRREARTWVGDVQVRGAWKGAGWGAFLAFLDQLQGPANSFLMPVANCRTPVAIGGEVYFETVDGKFGVVTGDDDFVVLPAGDPTLSANVPAGATVLTLSGAAGDALAVGAYFSIGDFLYRVSANDLGAVTFAPPARQAYTAGTVARVAAPRIRVRLESDAAAEEAHRIAALGAPFGFTVIEAFER